jgi:hypothetical protein
MAGPVNTNIRATGPALAGANDSEGRRLLRPPGIDEGPLPAAPREPHWNKVLHILVFAKFTSDDGKRILQDVAFLNHASGDSFQLIFAGYSEARPDTTDPSSGADEAIEISVSHSKRWYFNPLMFHRQVSIVEEFSTWEYRGGTQVLICDVDIADSGAAGVSAMFRKGRADLKHVIVIDIDELKDKKIIRDFDQLFNVIRNLMRRKHGSPASGESTLPTHQGQGKASLSAFARLSRWLKSYFVGPDNPTVNSYSTERVGTWHLSDALGLKGGAIAADVMAKVFELKWPAAALRALDLRHFAVRDISR